jgi:hypothetical protein
LRVRREEPVALQRLNILGAHEEAKEKRTMHRPRMPSHHQGRVGERARIAPIVRDVVLEPTDQPWGNRAMLFRDPDGNLINFFHPIRG